jgi:hypothetical protein
MQSYNNMGKKPICELNTPLRFINAYLLISSRSKCPFITARKRRWAPTQEKMLEISEQQKYKHLDPILRNICVCKFFFICFHFKPDAKIDFLMERERMLDVNLGHQKKVSSSIHIVRHRFCFERAHLCMP